MTQPYYQDDLVTLYYGDCRGITEWLAADTLVTDPPYGRNWRQGDLNNDARPGIAGDKDTTTRDEALTLWGQRPAIVFGDLMLTPPQSTRQVLVYRKAPDSGVRGATAGFRRDAEAIYLINSWPSGIGGGTSVLTTSARMVSGANGLASRYQHPHAKPVDLLQRLIALSSGTVADPFAGSGSTLVAAKLLGRRAIGVELEERYCETVARRLAQDPLPLWEPA